MQPRLCRCARHYSSQSEGEQKRSRKFSSAATCSDSLVPNRHEIDEAGRTSFRCSGGSSTGKDQSGLHVISKLARNTCGPCQPQTIDDAAHGAQVQFALSWILPKGW